MTDRTRRIATLFAVAAIVTPAALLALKSKEPDGTRAQPSQSVVKSAPASENEPGSDYDTDEIDDLSVAGPTSRDHAVESEGLPPSGYIDRESGPVLDTGQAFLDALFAHEADESGSYARQRLRELASPALAEAILTAKPRLPASLDRVPARGRIVALEIEFDKPPTTALVRGEVDRGGDLSGIGLILNRKDSQWIVTDMIE